MTMSENSLAPGSLPMELPSMSSRVASLARTSVLRGLREASLLREVGFGPRSSDWFAIYDRNSSSWRTSQICLEALLIDREHGLAEFSGTWPNAGMMRNGKIFEQVQLDCHMNGNERGWLPTPQKSDGMFLLIKRPLYFIAGAYRIRSNQGIDGNAKIADISLNLWGGPLNPQYAEAMMGFPLNWTNPESVPSVTP